MCNHKFKLDRQSSIIIDGKKIDINVYKCILCDGLRILDVETGEIVSVNGNMGTEV